MSGITPPFPLLQELLAKNDKWAGESKDLFPQNTQHPRIIWIGCADSRVPESVITSSVPGDIFVHRNVGAQFDPRDAALELLVRFALHAEGFKIEHIIIVGHTKCAGFTLRNFKLNLHNPAFTPFSYDEAPEIDAHVRKQVDNAARSPAISKAWAERRNLWVHGWVYDVQNGRLRDLGISRGPDSPGPR